MSQKMKNKTYQPLPLVINGQTVIVTSRKTLDDVEEVTDQMVTLKSVGMVQIIKK